MDTLTVKAPEELKADAAEATASRIEHVTVVDQEWSIGHADLRRTANSSVLSQPPLRAYFWGLLAALTCPCHLPLVALALAGTGAGALIAAHMGMFLLAMVGLFMLSLTSAWRAFHLSLDTNAAARSSHCCGDDLVMPRFRHSHKGLRLDA